MDEDDNSVRQVLSFPANLDLMSVDDMKRYIEELEAEIKRVEQTVHSRTSHLNAAQLIFKNKGNDDK